MRNSLVFAIKVLISCYKNVYIPYAQHCLSSAPVSALLKWNHSHVEKIFLKFCWLVLIFQYSMLMYHPFSTHHLPLYLTYMQESFYVCTQPMRDDVTFVTSSLIGWAHTQNDPCICERIMCLWCFCPWESWVFLLLSNPPCHVASPIMHDTPPRLISQTSAVFATGDFSLWWIRRIQYTGP